MTIKDHEFMFEAIEKVRKANEARRTIKEQILSDMGLASEQQLSLEKRRLLEERVDEILAGKDKEHTLTEESNLQELSKSTLASYIPKAHASGTAAAADQENAFMRGRKRNYEKYKRAGLTGQKREQGIKMAVKKLAKEDYDLQEVSDDLRSRAYAARAGRLQTTMGAHGAVEKGKEKENAMHSRKLQGQMDSAAGRDPKKNADRTYKAMQAGGAARAAVKKAKGLDVHGRPMSEEDYDLQELKDATVKRAIEKASGKAKAARRNSDSDAEYAYGSQAHRLKQALDRKKRRQKAEKYEPSAAKTRGIVKRNQAIEKHNRDMQRDSRGTSGDEETAAKEAAWRNDPIRRRRMKQGK